MVYIKLLHIICVFVWIGNLMTLTRLMGYHVKQDEHTQMHMARIYKRMYQFVELPTMILTVTLGIILISQVDFSQNHTWFIFKMLFVSGLVVCDLICGQYISNLNLEPDLSRGIKYKVLHGMTGLCLIGVLVSIYVLK